MSDESDRARDDATPDPSASSAEQDPWRDVLKGFDELGDAVTVWVKTAVNDPENRERAERLKTHFETAAHKVGEAVTSNEVGQQAKDVAVQAGGAAKDAGQRIGQEVAPSLVIQSLRSTRSRNDRGSCRPTFQYFKPRASTGE